MWDNDEEICRARKALANALADIITTIRVWPGGKARHHLSARAQRWIRAACQEEGVDAALFLNTGVPVPGHRRFEIEFKNEQFEKRFFDLDGEDTTIAFKIVASPDLIEMRMASDAEAAASLKENGNDAPSQNDICRERERLTGFRFTLASTDNAKRILRSHNVSDPDDDFHRPPDLPDRHGQWFWTAIAFLRQLDEVYREGIRRRLSAPAIDNFELLDEEKTVLNQLIQLMGRLNKNRDLKAFGVEMVPQGNPPLLFPTNVEELMFTHLDAGGHT
jgi:hypothetical protein